MSIRSELLELDQETKDLGETYCTTCSDVFEQSFKDRGLREPLLRLILIGKLDYANREIVKCYHEEAVKNIQENIMDDSSKPTGLMIIYKSFFYHIVEGSDEALNEVIESTACFVEKKLIRNAKVIRFTTVSFHYFDSWNACTILTPDYSDTSLEDADSSPESDVLTLAQMIRKFEDVVFVLASYVRYLESSEIDEKVNDLVPTSVLPFEDELETLYREPFFLSVAQYVERYLVPYDYTSFIEQEWPPSGPVHDATDYFAELDQFEKKVDDSLILEEEQRKKGRYGSHR